MRRAGPGGLILTALLLLFGRGAAASVTASIVVNGSVMGSDASAISISFNSLSESVAYDRTSTPQSIANAFAVKFARDGQLYGICAFASGNIINFKSKIDPFSNVAITDSNASFQLTSQGFGWTKTFVLSNVGNADLSVTGVSITGANASDFILQSNTCTGSPYSEGVHCTVTVSFAPSAPGVRTANLVIETDGAFPVQTIALSGNQ